MITENLKIEGVDEAIASFERLTAAINSACAAIDALNGRGGDVRIRVCGALADVTIKRHAFDGVVSSDSLKDMMRQINRDG